MKKSESNPKTDMHQGSEKLMKLDMGKGYNKDYICPNVMSAGKKYDKKKTK